MLLTAADLPPGMYLFGATAGTGERQFDALRTDLTRIVATIAASAAAGSSG